MTLAGLTVISTNGGLRHTLYGTFMSKLQSGQLRVTGKRHPHTGHIEFKLMHAADVPADAANWLYEQLTSPRDTLLTLLNSDNPKEEPFLQAWENRGYIPESIRFSIFTLAAKRPKLRRYRVPPQRTGVLYAKWARVQYDRTPDLVCSWRWPCTRRDMRFFHSFLSMPISGSGFSNSKTLWEELTEYGFDNTTWKFEVHHAAPWVAEAD